MQVNSVTSPYATAASSATSSDASAPVTAKKSLDQQDFLKLLAVQFQQQDPLQPMNDTSFIAQMAQFTSLQQTGTLVQQMTQLSTSQGVAAANTYLGHQVTLDDGSGNGTTVTGTVTAVDLSSGTPQLVVNGSDYALSSVLRVEPAPVGTTTPTASSNSVKP